MLNPVNPLSRQEVYHFAIELSTGESHSHENDRRGLSDLKVNLFLSGATSVELSSGTKDRTAFLYAKKTDHARLGGLSGKEPERVLSYECINFNVLKKP